MALEGVHVEASSPVRSEIMELLQLMKCVVTMVHLKNRYMVLEVFIDAGHACEAGD